MRRASLLHGASLAAFLVAGCPPPAPPDAGPLPDGSMDCSADGYGDLDAGMCPVHGGDTSECMDLSLGTGRDGTLDGYRVLQPGDTVYITPGEQGLQHVLLALRGRGFDPSGPIVDARIVDAANCNEVGHSRLRFAFVQDPADATQLALQTVRVLVADDENRFEYCTVLDRDVVLVVVFDDGHGHRAHRELRLHVGGIDPNARPDIRQAWESACADR